MQIHISRFKSALNAMSVHFCVSLMVALLIAALVFAVWYPYPYRELSGGRELFLLVIGVDLVCGPLLTLVLYNPAKSRRELVLDLSLVVVLQLAALGYGVWTVWLARPLYLVNEFDRFKVIALVDVDAAELEALPNMLKSQFFRGPIAVGLRATSKEERQKVMLESVQGGRDFGERPYFYANYDGLKTYAIAKPLENFVKKYPNKVAEIDKLRSQYSVSAAQLRYLPIIARQDWVAVLNEQGSIIGYLQGDGF
jgi:hypothetical protein